MSDDGERAWERWAKEHRWFARTSKEAFLAGFAAGIEEGRDLRDADLDERWKPPSPEDR